MTGTKSVDSEFSTDDSLEPALVLDAEEVKALVGAVAHYLGLSNLSQVLVAFRWVIE